MASLVLRTFISRDVTTMMLLYKSYVQSHLEYCCPLWSPHMQCEIIKLEAVQRSFTAKIQGLGNLNYWERLRRLSMYSLQRRRERYTIILVWKILLTLTTFKPALDAFLNEFPDTPPTPVYTGQNRNSMLEWAGGTCL